MIEKPPLFNPGTEIPISDGESKKILIVGDHTVTLITPGEEHIKEELLLYAIPYDIQEEWTNNQILNSRQHQLHDNYFSTITITWYSPALKHEIITRGSPQKTIDKLSTNYLVPNKDKGINALVHIINFWRLCDEH